MRTPPATAPPPSPADPHAWGHRSADPNADPESVPSQTIPCHPVPSRTSCTVCGGTPAATAGPLCARCRAVVDIEVAVTPRRVHSRPVDPGGPKTGKE